MLPSGCGRCARCMRPKCAFLAPAGDQAVIDAICGKDRFYAQAAVHWCEEEDVVSSNPRLWQRLLDSFAGGETSVKLKIYKIVNSCTYKNWRIKMTSSTAATVLALNPWMTEELFYYLRQQANEKRSLHTASHGQSGDRWLACMTIPSLEFYSADQKQAVLLSVLDNDADQTVRDAAMLALGVLGREMDDAAAIVDQLMPMFRDSKHREYAIRAIGIIGPKATRAVPQLCELLSVADCLAETIRTLSRIGPAAAAASEALEEISGHDLAGDDAHDATFALKVISGERRDPFDHVNYLLSDP